MVEEPTSLKICIAEADRKRLHLANAPNPNSALYQENLISTIAKYVQSAEIAVQASIFSRNETLEDVSTGDLQFLLPHFHIAELVLRQQHENRKAVLERARKEYDLYLAQLDAYDALSRDDAKLYEQYRAAPNQFSIASSTEAAVRRTAKIARFRAEKSLKDRLEMLRKDPEVLRGDDRIVRDLYMTNINFCTHQAFQSLESIAQELHILSLMPPEPANGHDPEHHDERHARNAASDNYSERLDLPTSRFTANGPILDKDGRPMRPFTLLDNRQRLREGVFRPGHNLPTMTIDEYLEEEKRRGGIVEGGGAQSGIRPQVDEDDMDITDRATMKARAWDDFKDDNPKGAGNTMSMG